MTAVAVPARRGKTSRRGSGNTAVAHAEAANSGASGASCFRHAIPWHEVLTPPLVETAHFPQGPALGIFFWRAHGGPYAPKRNAVCFVVLLADEMTTRRAARLASHPAKPGARPCGTCSVFPLHVDRRLICWPCLRMHIPAPSGLLDRAPTPNQAVYRRSRVPKWITAARRSSAMCCSWI